MGPPSYMRSIAELSVVMRHIIVLEQHTYVIFMCPLMKLK